MWMVDVEKPPMRMVDVERPPMDGNDGDYQSSIDGMHHLPTAEMKTRALSCSE